MPFVNELLYYVTDVFVETGTYEGDTIHLIANNNICSPSKIISLELSDVYFSRCKQRFENNSNIILYKGNSKYDLYNKIKDIPAKITFWLDSHWLGTQDVGCDIITVLEQIKQHYLNIHTIMIDNIHLMNSFPVNIDQIIAKIYEINPNYTVKYFDNYMSPNDVLVAYIESQCVHNYLTKCSTNPQSPGLADFLRGTVCLYNFSKQYDYTLFIDGKHPIFTYLENNKNIIYCDSNIETEEYITPTPYHEIYHNLNDIFKTGRSFSTFTNSFYNLRGYTLDNFGEISKECSDYIRYILTPTIEVETKIKDIFRTVYKIKLEDGYKVIHLRFGDLYLHHNGYNDELYNLYYNIMQYIINNDKNEKYILISDSSIMANKLKTNIPELYYWDNSKIHIGDLINIETSNLLDTLVDFFIISRSKEIFATKSSGFSRINSLIYNIKYTTLDIGK